MHPMKLLTDTHSSFIKVDDVAGADQSSGSFVKLLQIPVFTP